MSFCIGFTFACLLAIANSESIDNHNCGFTLHATCDDQMKLFADGKPLDTSNNWKVSSMATISADTSLIEIHCQTKSWIGGILASSDKGMLTNSSWECSADQGRNYHPASEMGLNGNEVPDISAGAHWIWTGQDKNDDNDVRCRINLDQGGTCPDDGGSSVDCQKKEGHGQDYVGTASKTKSGLTCQKWTSQSPHRHRYADEGDHNYCRNPDEDDDGVWCHTTNPKIKFEYCDVPFCGTTKPSTETCTKTIKELPISVAGTISASSGEHCCKEVSSGESNYKLAGSYSEADRDQYGCFDTCVYEDANGGNNKVCFITENYRCLVVSDNFNQHQKNALNTSHAMVSLLEEKTEKYGKMKHTDLKTKLAAIKEDIKPLRRTYTGVRSDPRSEPHKNELIGHFAEKTNHIDLDLELDAMNDKLKYTAEPDSLLQETKHHLIEATRAISSIMKSKVEKGLDGFHNLVNSIVENTEADTRITRTKIMARSGCDGSVITNQLGATATGCLGGGPIGCAGGAITGGIDGMITCMPDLIAEVGCFSTVSQVETMSGKKKISELLIGDFVRTASSGESHTYFTEFLGWMDRNQFSPVEMLQVSTEETSTLTLTGSHIVFTSNSNKYADELQLGDFLMLWNGTHIGDQKVIEIQKSIGFGWWAPLTRDGTLLVDGYLASCYASFSHQLSDLAMTPVKAIPTVLLDNEESQHKDGPRSVVKLMKKTGEWIGARERNMQIFKEENEFEELSSINMAPQFNNLITKSEF